MLRRLLRILAVLMIAVGAFGAAWVFVVWLEGPLHDAVPFADIDSLRPGDSVTLELPYGTFRYHRIVSADDVSVLRSHGREQLAPKS